MSEVLHGQGATPERMKKSSIEKGVRSVTKGGIPDSYGHQDTEHCALDHLLNSGLIDEDQYQAGYDLRNLYYKHKQSAKSCCAESSGGHDGDEMTPSDEAYEAYRAALKSVGNGCLIETVCCESLAPIPSYYTIMQDISYGLDDLVEYFTKKRKG